MSKILMRQVISSLLPSGPVWEVEEGSDFDKYLLGKAQNWEDVRSFLSNIRHTRNPFKTTVLSDLEKEHGIPSDDRISDSIRRNQLASEMFSVGGTGSSGNLQEKLVEAGFSLQVHNNSPAVDPATFLTEVYRMIAGGDAAFAGNAEALCGAIGGELVANGDLYTQEPAYDMQAGGDIAYAGNASAQVGFYNQLRQVPIIFDIPTDPDSWPFVFFVGGDATRNGSGELTDIQIADVPIARRQQLLRIILKTKPLHSWCGLLVNYT